MTNRRRPSVSLMLVLGTLAAGLALGAVFAARVPRMTLPTAAAESSASKSAPADVITIDADSPGEAAHVAGVYLIETLGGSHCQGGGGAEGPYELDPELISAADSSQTTERWLRGDRVWLGRAGALIQELDGELIPGATAAGDMWIIMRDADGPYAQHLVEHRTPGERSIWLVFSRIVSLDPSECE